MKMRLYAWALSREHRATRTNPFATCSPQTREPTRLGTGHPVLLFQPSIHEGGTLRLSWMNAMHLTARLAPDPDLVEPTCRSAELNPPEWMQDADKRATPRFQVSRSVGDEALVETTGAIHECHEHGWAKDRTDPHAREEAFRIASEEPLAGLSPTEAVVAVQEALQAVGDTCPEC